MSALLSLIRARYAAPEWAVFEEVADSTGFNARRWADAVAIGIWPSRGFAIHGFECKAHRSDWLRELKQPEKAEPIFRYCDAWWLVAEPDVATLEEIPAAWGWLEVRGKKLHVRKPAPKLEPQAISRAFVASMLRKVPEKMVPKADLAAAVDTEVTRRRALDDRYNEGERLSRRYEELREQVDAFSRASGITISEYSGGRELGEAVARLQRSDSLLRGRHEQLMGDAERFERIAAAIRKELDEATPKPVPEAP